MKLTAYKEGKEVFNKLYQDQIQLGCSPGYLSALCDKNHATARPLFCGKEYCMYCGLDGSPVHQRRFNRIMPKIRAHNQTGCVVVTFPFEVRQKLKSKFVLSAIRTNIKNALKKLGYDKGIMRWHYFGDCPCSKKGKARKNCKQCDGTGAGNNWHPHLNVLIESGFIKNVQNNYLIQSIQAVISKYFKKHFNTSFTAVVNYKYKRSIEHKAHIVKYVTRSTFRNYNQEIADLLHNYRTTTSFGKWRKKIAITEAEDNKLCKCCMANGEKNKIQWQIHLNQNIYDKFRFTKAGGWQPTADNEESNNQQRNVWVRLEPNRSIAMEQRNNDKGGERYNRGAYCTHGTAWRRAINMPISPTIIDAG